MLRSWLFVPGNHERRMKKALELPADAVIIDLEDAVPLAEKKQARQMVVDLLARNERNNVFIRINDFGIGYAEEDLKAIVPLKPTGVMLPKAESKADVVKLDNLLGELEVGSGIASGSIAIIPLIESALGVLEARQIATASTRNICLSFGAIDFTLDIGTELSMGGNELLFARSYLVLAARAAKIGAPIDTVYPQIKDEIGLHKESILAKQLGMFGKLVIHPDQIGVVNEVFSPAEEEILYAKKVLAAYKEAEEQGIGAIQVEGKFIDYPVAIRAEQVLNLAAKIGLV